MKAHIVIIDDNKKVCESLAHNFVKIGYTCSTAVARKEAVRIFQTAEPAAAILDLKLGNENGLEVLREIQEIAPQVPVLIITGFATIETAVEAIKIGAYDYLQKPVNFTKLQKSVENAVKMYTLRCENQALHEQLTGISSSIVTCNSTMLQILGKVVKLAGTELPLLIDGESGTGKELFAEYIHRHSERKSYKLEKINCAAFPETLLDNELFGHERGAYTGADERFLGVFERAHRGSLFLDEIGDMPLSIQSKILRTLQNSEIRRLGGKETLKVDVRFIAATNKDIQGLIKDGKFREDLFYRLNAAMIRIPPLRERREDIELLCSYFLKELSDRNERSSCLLCESVLDLFTQYHWPGNIRELKNVINYAETVSNGELIGLEDLPPYLFENAADRENTNLKENMEKDLILKILKQTNYNKKRTAELLKICRKTLYNKIEKYDITT